MSSRLLTPLDFPNLQPANYLWDRYLPQEAPYRFQAEKLEEAIHWQDVTRPALVDALGFTDLPRPPIVETIIESSDCGDYIRQKVLIQTAPKILMPVYLLLPKNQTGPIPTVIAFHGHGYGVKDIVGLWEDGTERGQPDGYHKDFAIALCRKGFAVAAPEISCFGERQTDFSYLDTVLGQPLLTTCHHSAHLALHLGGTVLGLRIFDAQRLVDYLETRPEFDTTHLGAMGISGGGMHTLFSTCLDLRIKACVISGYYSTFAASLLAMDHCLCQFVPGMARFGEMYDLIGLVAPRPVLVEAASRDPIFPIAAVRSSVERAQQVYSVFGLPENVQTDLFEGRHEISGRKAYDFLWDNLAKDMWMGSLSTTGMEATRSKIETIIKSGEKK